MRLSAGRSPYDDPPPDKNFISSDHGGLYRLRLPLVSREPNGGVIDAHSRAVSVEASMMQGLAKPVLSTTGDARSHGRALAK